VTDEDLISDQPIAFVDYLLRAALIFLLTLTARAQEGVYLEPREYITADTSQFESFRLRVMNQSDSAVVITSFETSCGCFLASVQRSVATRQHPGELFISLTVDALSKEQPTTVDVFTTAAKAPLRLTIWRKGSKP
jgi:hypothetical protein